MCCLLVLIIMMIIIMQQVRCRRGQEGERWAAQVGDGWPTVRSSEQSPPVAGHDDQDDDQEEGDGSGVDNDQVLFSNIDLRRINTLPSPPSSRTKSRPMPRFEFFRVVPWNNDTLSGWPRKGQPLWSLVEIFENPFRLWCLSGFFMGSSGKAWLAIHGTVAPGWVLPSHRYYSRGISYMLTRNQWGRSCNMQTNCCKIGLVMHCMQMDI